MAKVDITGQRFGRLVALSRLPLPNLSGLWLCRCDCGREKIARIGNLRRGDLKSCGCAQYVKGHGGRRTRLYRIWSEAIQRCENPNSTFYRHYGGRGIRMCDQWRQDFAAFRAWALAHGYASGLTIDRIDNNGNYEPANCRWATRTQQARNKSNNLFVTFNGETRALAEWAELTGIKRGTLKSRLNMGWSADRALTERPQGPRERMNARMLAQ